MFKDDETTYKERYQASGIFERMTEENAVQTNTDGVQSDIDGLQGIDKEYLKTRITEAIQDYETEENVDCKAIKQLQWNAVLEYIADTVIKPMRLNIKDSEVCMILAKIYLSICHQNLKSSSLYGYSILSCIPYSVLLNSNKNNNYIYIDIDNDYRYIDSKAIALYRSVDKYKGNHIIKVFNDTYTGIAKMITEDREHCLTDKTEDGSIPSLALGKIEFGWIESAKEKIQVQEYEKYRLPSDIIKELTDN